MRAVHFKAALVNRCEVIAPSKLQRRRGAWDMAARNTAVLRLTR